MWTIYGLLVPAITALFAGLGGYFGAYFKKKGENLATHEDLGKLVKQMEATTKATEEIKAEISDHSWNKQKYWEMKRDAVFNVVETLGRADDSLLALAGVYHIKLQKRPSDWEEMKLSKSLQYQAAINAYDEKRFVASLVCGDAMDTAMTIASKNIRAGASKVFKWEITDYSEISSSIQRPIFDVMTLARTELGLPTEQRVATSQSSESSATPTPDS